jgi:hypothetical protein
MIEVIRMHKKDVLTALPPPFGVMAQPVNIDNAINVHVVTAPSYGKPAIIESIGVGIGSVCGLAKAIRLGGCANFLATVPLLLITLRIIGLIRYPRKKFNTPRSGTCFMMRPIFIRMAAC